MSDQKKMKEVIDLNKFESITLEEAYKKHRAYVEKYMMGKLKVESFENMSDKDKTRLTKDFIHCLHDELSELLNFVHWKHWKDYSGKKIDNLEAKYEIVDMQHFLFNLCFIFGMDMEEFGRMFNAKLSENVRRQEEGY